MLFQRIQCSGFEGNNESARQCVILPRFSYREHRTVLSALTLELKGLATQMRALHPANDTLRQRLEVINDLSRHESVLFWILAPHVETFGGRGMELSLRQGWSIFGVCVLQCPLVLRTRTSATGFVRLYVMAMGALNDVF